MKAIQIMLFLLMFNLALSTISVTGIYQIAIGPEGEQTLDQSNLYGDTTEENTPHDAEEEYSMTVEANMGVRDTIAQFTFSILSGITVGILLGILTWKGVGVPGDAAFGYSLFATTFWFCTINSAMVLGSIGNFNAGVSIIIGVFLLACGIMFIVGFAQLIKGGWKAFI